MMMDADNLRSALGVLAILALCWLVSEDRRRFPVLLAFGAVAAQAGLLLLFFALPGAGYALSAMNAGVDGLAAATRAGTQFVFGYLGGGPQPYDVTRSDALFVFAFEVLPLILVISALSALLWHLRILKWITQAFGLVFQKTMGLGGASALAAATNIFMGMVESPIVIRAYLDKLTRSELFLMMTVGLATVAGSTMVAYAALLKASLPDAAGHVLAASIISAPAAILLARIMIPEQPGQGGAYADYGSALHYDGPLDAITRGVSDGLQIVLNIAATLLVFVALVAIANQILTLLPPVFGEAITLERMLGLLFTPLAWLIGVPAEEAGAAGRLLGVKSVLTEFVAFVELAKTPAEVVGPRTRMMLTYALCGFANIGSVGIMISGVGVLLPQRRAEILELAWKSLLPGFLATCMTAAIVGVLPAAMFR